MPGLSERFYNDSLFSVENRNEYSMTKGFAPVVASAKLKNIKTQHQPISMQELEGGLLNYFDDVPDPRVDRTRTPLT